MGYAWAIVFEQRKYGPKTGFKKPIVVVEKDGRLAVFASRAAAVKRKESVFWDGRATISKVTVK